MRRPRHRDGHDEHVYAPALYGLTNNGPFDPPVSACVRPAQRDLAAGDSDDLRHVGGARAREYALVEGPECGKPDRQGEGLPRSPPAKSRGYDLKIGLVEAEIEPLRRHFPADGRPRWPSSRSWSTVNNVFETRRRVTSRWPA